MTQLHADPEKLIKLANGVEGSPWQAMNEAGSLLDGCKLDARGFGTIGSAVLGGSYESARGRFKQTVGDAGDAILDAANGLAKVANLYAEAESSNTSSLSIGAPSQVPIPVSSGGHDGFGSVAIGVGAFAVDIILFPIFVAVHGSITACAAMAPSIFVAETLWMLTKPDDTELNQALGNWRLAATQVAESQATLQQLMQISLEDAWPSGDGARPQFDQWMNQLTADLQQLDTAIANAPDVFGNAASEVHSTNTWMLGVVIGAMASLIALTACDIFFGAGEPAKQVVAAVLIAAVGAGVASILTIITTMAIDLANLLSGNLQFGRLGQSDTPQFNQTPISSWLTEPVGVGPMFTPGTSVPADPGGGPSTPIR